ncbi:flagellar biosynthesis anti-sigma factor FlgM [Keratinibaculum paraultunense]|nr:flagellar biosynthesis anti-sigma factor FlgM [Keratinibaculum paraultunense]QQY79147.1 flagellar biosynthesis anti-sigma factor FlgM [Keratinibaculum paraultunense]
MKINKTDNIMQIYNINNMNSNKVSSNKNKLEKDNINLSERAKDYQFAVEKIKELPDIRMEKVKYLKEKIQSGKYNIDGKEIVEKMFENIHIDERI